jgi:hypothetical protein
MPTTISSVEIHAIEQLPEQELEEARTIQGVLLAAQPLRTPTVTISHEFQPAAEVGRGYLDYFQLSDRTIGRISGTFRAGVYSRRYMRPWRWERCVGCTRPDASPIECCQC